MSESVQNWLNQLTKVGTVLLILSTLFLFSNLTTDFYDSPKFLILLIFTGALLILTTLKFNLINKVTFIRTPLDLPLLLLLAVAIISTFTSSSLYTSLLGQGGLIHNSLTAAVTYVLFYFVLVNNLRSLKEIKQVVFWLSLAGALLAVTSLLAYAGLKILPSPWNHGLNFTPAGSNFSATAFLTLLLPFSLIELLSSRGKILNKLVHTLLLTLFGVVIALTGNFATMTVAGVSLIVCLVLFRPRLNSLSHILENQGLVLLVIPIVVIGLVVALSYTKPLGNAKNPLYSQFQAFPRTEVTLPFPISWKVSVSAFRDSPFWGTGPATYLFDFTQYKPIEFNQTKNWNIRFDAAFNEYLAVLATLGGIGLAALIFATTFYFSAAYKAYLQTRNQIKDLTPSLKLYISLAISGSLFFLILLLHTSTLVFLVMGFLILACFMSVNGLVGTDTSKAWKNQSGLKQILMRVASSVNLTDSSSEVVRLDALPPILLTLAIALVGAVLFFGAKFALADYHHRQALNAVSQNQGLQAYNELVSAEKLNPYSDLFRSDLAQTNFALANAIAIAKGPTEASPSGSFTDQDRQNVQTLLQQAINEGRTATTLSPKNAVNWEVLAAIYRQISGVAQNALLFSLDAYGRAIQNDPLNPILRLNVGGTYYAIKNYDLAIRFFTDAVNLKPDFANGYYNLAVAFKDKGDMQSALAAAQKTVDLIPDKGGQDYQIASRLLEELKSASGQAGGSTDLTAPTAQNTGALQKEQPKVVELPKPSSIATPSAVKKPNSTPEPSP